MKKTEFDYLVLGGGTAGVVVAARLAEAGAEVALVEAGPSDSGDRRVVELRQWPNLLGTELDYDYRIEPQPRGNSRIRHSRGRVLGGCSSHNSAIAFQTPSVDLREWVRRGADGWGPDEVASFFRRVRERVPLEVVPPDNECTAAFVTAAREAGYPLADFANADACDGVGWFVLNKRGPLRASSSMAYFHPFNWPADALTVLTDTPVSRIVVNDHGDATGAETIVGHLQARHEIVLCAGAFDSPKLLLLSGIGPAEHLRDVGVAVRHDLPGVGDHLIDHPEGVVMWESSRPVPQVTTQFWEAGLFIRTDPTLDAPDLMFHFGTVPFDINTAPLGYPTAQEEFCLTPNVTRARSEGTVRLRSADPTVPPVIDPCYFTDPDGHDERVMLAGIKLARQLAEQPALRAWTKRELAPGPSLRGDAELSEYARRSANTVYHPAGTCRMGASDDAGTVVDSQLRVRGVGRLRVADASIFPSMIGVNPCLTCLMIGERCAAFLLNTPHLSCDSRIRG
jgi:choline oxidase